MILAAGLGTRLRPLTNDRPKALVEVAGRALLEIAISRLCEIGVGDFIVNTHHHATMIRDYLAANDNFGARIVVSQEDELLDTGGGLQKAAPFFLGSTADSQEPFILHNVDVISTIDLSRMIRFHIDQGALATLAVQDRPTSRYLLFDTEANLCGRRTRLPATEAKSQSAQDELVRPAAEVQPLAFSGIHVISPRLLSMIREQGAFSIITTYLDLAARGEDIAAFRADQYYWRDLGRPESITRVEQEMKTGVYPAH
jgi:NDP-sugar pyrophosphorylase family protein